MKGKAWDFVMKLGREADLTGLDLKKPKGATDRRVRTARVDDNFRAVLFAVGEENQPMWLLAAIKPHDDAYRHAETLTLTVNPASGTKGPAQGSPGRVADFPERPSTIGTGVLPFPVADLVALGWTPRSPARLSGRPTRTRCWSWPSTCRSGSNGRCSTS